MKFSSIVVSCVVVGSATAFVVPVSKVDNGVLFMEKGAGGMFDTRNPDAKVDSDPRKSISAAPSFEEYLKSRGGGSPAVSSVEPVASSPVVGSTAASPVVSNNFGTVKKSILKKRWQPSSSSAPAVATQASTSSFADSAPVSNAASSDFGTVKKSILQRKWQPGASSAGAGPSSYTDRLSGNENPVVVQGQSELGSASPYSQPASSPSISSPWASSVQSAQGGSSSSAFPLNGGVQKKAPWKKSWSPK